MPLDMTAVASAHHIAQNTKMRGRARLGLASHGALYVLLGVLALVLAFGGRRKETDQKGAFEELAENSAGWVLLLIIAIGLAAYALWRLAEAAFGVSGVDDGDGAKQRLISAARGIGYGALAVSAFTIVVNGKSANQSKRQETWTAKVMEHDGGRWLVGLAGVVVVVIGGVLAVRGAMTKFEKHSPMRSMSPAAQKTTTVTGLVGSIARGVVLAMVGVLLITAAVQFDPKKARGIDGALRTLRDTPVGPWLLALVAVGLVLFGVFGFCEARWRKL
jgi:hypothetical protein